MNRVFVDMDGVIADFDRFMTENQITSAELKKRPGGYLDLKPIPGAIEGVRRLISQGFEVWIATKPPTGIPYAYADKVSWILKHLPELKRRVILTHDKGLLGDAGDYLLDDHPARANCEQFAGTLLRFENGYHWPQALAFLDTVQPNLGSGNRKQNNESRSLDDAAPARFRLTLRSAVNPCNDNEVADFRDERTAQLIGDLLLKLDANDHPEYNRYDVRPVDINE